MSKEPATTDTSTDMVFTISATQTSNASADQSWFQENLDLSIPLLIIIIGLFQFVLRKWLAPVDEDTIFEMEDQAPGNAIMLHPKVGVIIMLIGFILLLVFNINKIL